MYSKSKDGFKEIERYQRKEDSKAELKELLSKYLGTEEVRYQVIQAQRHKESLADKIDKRAREMRELNNQCKSHNNRNNNTVLNLFELCSR